MVANSELQRVGLNGWRTGLANLLHKENRAWWASRRWLVQSLLWTVLMNGVVALNMYADGVTEDSVSMAIAQLFQMGALALPVGAILLAHAETVSERQLGVTEWLLSKPVSRPAYVLSKLLAHGLGVLVVLVGLQSALGYGVLWLLAGAPLPLTPYLVSVAGLAVNTLFYLTLTLMMGVLTSQRGALLGAPLGILLGGLLFGGFLGTLLLVTPWALLQVLPAVVQGVTLPVPIWVSIGVTALLTAVFVAVALVRFERLEF